MAPAGGPRGGDRWSVFLATWVLHAYQSFWLRGTWGFSVPDALFWGVLGVLVLVNVQLDARRSREPERRPGPGSARRPRRTGGSSSGPLAIRGLKTAATFTTIALLWSLWSSPSLAAWLDLMHRGLLGASDKEPDRDGDTTQSTSVASARITMLQSVALLVVALRPLAPELDRASAR